MRHNYFAKAIFLLTPALHTLGLVFFPAILFVFGAFKTSKNLATTSFPLVALLFHLRKYLPNTRM